MNFAICHGESVPEWPNARYFRADGIGGRELEAAIRTGQFVGVCELDLSELAAELCKTQGGAGPDRLTAAALRGIPQVIVPGGIDRVRTETGWRPTTPAECDKLGLEVAQKACAAKAPTAILLPTRGFFAKGNPAGSAFSQSLQNWIYGVEVIEVDCHWNELAELALKKLLGMLS